MPKDTPQVSQLEELDIKSVGLVGKAANKWKFALFKSRDEEKEMPEDVKKEDQEEAVVAEEAAEPVEKVSFRDQFAAAMRDFFNKGEPTPEPEPEVAPEIEAVLKAQAEQLEQAQADLAEMKEAFAKSEAQRKEAEYLTKAESLAIPGEVKDLADLMKQADAAGFGDALTAVLDASSAAIVQSGIFVEKGTQADEDASDYMGQINKRAAELQAENAKLTKDEAVAAAIKEGRIDPDLARGHLAKRQSETGGRK